VEGAADGGAVPRAAREGDGAAVHRRARGESRERELPLRGMRGAAVSERGEVRLGLRVAELHAAGGVEGCGRARGHEPGNAARGGDMRAVRRASGACVSGWAAADGITVLH